jgi:hypothetical protein
VPASLELQEVHGDDLAVIFVECQGADDDTAEAFAWRQKWMGTAAMWTTERPMDPEGRGLPAFALLDVEGKLLLSGNPLAMKKEIEEAIASEVKRAKVPPTGTPPELAKVWASFVKGDVTAALAACDKFGEGELGEAAKSLRKEMIARTESRLARASWMGDNGYASDALARLGELAKDVKGNLDFEPKLTKELARLQAADRAAEIEASKSLAALQQKMLKDKPFEDSNAKALAKLAEKHAGTKAGERAARLARLAKLEGMR